MRLAVCNIAWDEAEQEEVLELLREHGATGVEVAPTKLWPEWRGADEAAAKAVAERFLSAGFVVPALQAILFGRPELQVFGTDQSRQALLEHLSRVGTIARGLGAKVLVFGSPKNRERGSLSPREAFTQAVIFFREAAAVCKSTGTVLCIEPNPEGYGCKFVTRWREAVELAEAVDHPGFGLHLDTGCIHMAGDDPAEAVRSCADVMRHLHVSEPQLADLCQPVVDHERVARVLHESGYGHWVSLEMRRPDPAIRRIRTSVVWNDRIFLTQALSETKQRALFCIDRESGQEVWRRGVRYDEPEASHKTNPYCSASPATDGECVIAWFGSAGLMCWDMEGNELWRRDLGKQDHMWGYGSSPILHEDLCILLFGPGSNEFLLAVDKKTGQTRWKVDSLSDDAEFALSGPENDGGANDFQTDKERNERLRGAWSTPLIVKVDDHYRAESQRFRDASVLLTRPAEN